MKRVESLLLINLAVALPSLFFLSPVQAVILDDEPAKKPATKAEPKVKKTSALERENQRIKQELEAVKKAKQQLESLREQQSLEKQRADEVENAKKSVADSIEMITLPSGILMGKYEVTQAQWREIMGNNPSKFTGCGDNCPVENVSWDDVQSFIQRLNNQTGKHFRLPREDEWYYACQGGSGNSEYCGPSNIDAVAWYAANSGNMTHTVGQKQPNAYGLYDMSGNVWEWTDSCEKNDCSQRVHRGGSWISQTTSVRSASRDKDSSAYHDNLLGFRLAQER